MSSVAAFGEVDTDTVCGISADNALHVLSDNWVRREFDFSCFEHGSQGHVAFCAFGGSPDVRDEDEADLCGEVPECIAHVLIGVEDGDAVGFEDVCDFLEDESRT